MRHAIGLLIGLTICTAEAQQQPAAPQPAAPPRPAPRPRSPIERFMDQANGAPTPIFADLMFRLIETRPMSTADQRMLLAEIFDRAYVVRQATPLLPVVGLGGEEARQAAQVQRLGLDELSIRTRALSRMLDLDPKLARNYWNRTPPLRLKKGDCSSGTVPAVESYYQVMEQVVRRAEFTDDERARRVPMRIVEQVLGSMTTSAELAAALAVVPHLRSQGMDGLSLSSSLTSSVEAIQDSDRGFTAALTRQGLVQAAGKAFSDGSGVAFYSALRVYLMRHLSAPRCQDSVDSEAEAIEDFNRLAASTFGMVAPITEKERRSGKVSTDRFTPKKTDDTGFQAMLAEIGRLLPRDEKGFPQPGTLSVSDWQFQAAGLMRRVDEWHGREKADPQELFQQKAELWNALCENFPAGELYDQAVQRLVDLLSDLQTMKLHPVAWKLQVNRSLRLLHTAPEAAAARANELEIRGFPPDGYQAVPRAFRRSGNIILRMYGELEEAAAKP